MSLQFLNFQLVTLINSNLKANLIVNNQALSIVATNL